MTRRLATVILFGLLGTAILCALGYWQLQRLAWKEGVIAAIEARLQQDPVAVPETPDPEADKYLSVVADGVFTGEELRVLWSVQGVGPGARLISVFEMGDRRVLVDRGFRPEGPDAPGALSGPARVSGNLHWPQETDRFTPAPDLLRNLWFARDVPAMADALAAEPVLIVAREMSLEDPTTTPLPVNGAGLPNNHLGYAVQWFGLALVWLGMTAFLGWRITRRTA